MLMHSKKKNNTIWNTIINKAKSYWFCFKVFFLNWKNDLIKLTRCCKVTAFKKIHCYSGYTTLKDQKLVVNIHQQFYYNVWQFHKIFHESMKMKNYH